jgi:hypothetical protein
VLLKLASDISPLTCRAIISTARFSIVSAISGSLAQPFLLETLNQCSEAELVFNFLNILS